MPAEVQSEGDDLMASFSAAAAALVTKQAEAAEAEVAPVGREPPSSHALIEVETSTLPPGRTARQRSIDQLNKAGCVTKEKLKLEGNQNTQGVLKPQISVSINRSLPPSPPPHINSAPLSSSQTKTAPP